MAINTQSAFVRVTFDLPTPVALELSKAVAAANISKKKWLEKLITDAVMTANKVKKK